MGKIVTNISELDCHLSSRGILNIEVLLDNDHNHPALAEVLGVYIEYHINSALINIAHPDMECVSLEDLRDYLKDNYNFPIVTRNYVATKLIFPDADIIDLNLVYYFNNNKGFPQIHKPPLYSFIYKQHKSKNNNKFIPLEIHLKRFDSLIKQIPHDVFDEGWEETKILADTYMKLALSPIGVIDEANLSKYINKQVIDRHVKDGLLYPLYKATSITSRPICNFRGLNISTLSKKNNQREFIIPTNDYLLELDYDGFHPRILGELVGYKIPKDKSFHEEMAQLYFGEVTPERYQESKELTFKQIYGGVYEEYKHLKYFELIDYYLNDLWVVYNANMLTSPFFKRPMLPENIGTIGKQALLNYYIQAYETEHNILILEEIFKYLEGKKSRLILYNYDAFLFDIDESENVVEGLKDIVSKTFPIHEKRGENYAVLS